MRREDRGPGPFRSEYDGPMRTSLALVVALAGCNPGGMTSGTEGSGASSGANSDASSSAATGAATGSTTATSTAPTTGTATNGGTTTAGSETSTGGPPPGDLPVGHCGAHTGRYFGP